MVFGGGVQTFTQYNIFRQKGRLNVSMFEGFKNLREKEMEHPSPNFHTPQTFKRIICPPQAPALPSDPDPSYLYPGGTYAVRCVCTAGAPGSGLHRPV